MSPLISTFDVRIGLTLLQNVLLPITLSAVAVLKWYLLSFLFKGALSGLRQFLQTESHSKIMKNASYFTLKGLRS